MTPFWDNEPCPRRGNGLGHYITTGGIAGTCFHCQVPCVRASMGSPAALEALFRKAPARPAPEYRVRALWMAKEVLTKSRAHRPMAARFASEWERRLKRLAVIEELDPRPDLLEDA